MTRRLSGIHAAWHFWYAVSFGGESGLREVGLCGIHPLTQRYNLVGNNELSRIPKNGFSPAYQMDRLR
ncbi:TPA: DUF3265 domain-containing protein [Vibrio vulnificus]|nr:DUF3265 domain-containing protein [Vibrio vulnificus]HDY8137082.1 DUF3265 domain-containing protein [Vibrio vulnificus]HDY8150583.1 DUF3265 domain-containing protein [Vibrio vulnificus]HDY8155080.1 DUF3265 domain-containing protein [Vibrio vulnificus]